ncbi:MAG: hypothetical protein GYB67_06215 [Chloroflexi bacterium]|nr:hypothetical protein [Chloroflexota bacterium]
MSSEFHNQQRRIDQDHERQRAKLQKHETIETWHIEQEEAQRGNIASPEEADVEPPQPHPLVRLWKRLTGR